MGTTDRIWIVFGRRISDQHFQNEILAVYDDPDLAYEYVGRVKKSNPEVWEDVWLRGHQVTH